MKLEIGNRGKLRIRHEHYCFAFDKTLHVLFLSDFHFNKYSENTVKQLIDNIDQLKIDIILLGGDYVDTKKGLIHLERFLTKLSVKIGVFAVAGNHDYFFGIEKIKQLMVHNQVNWIEKDSIVFEFFGKTIRIDGNRLTTENNVDFSILCMHKPIQFNKARYTYNLIFAGHLHGSQIVFWETEKGLYPGKLFYKWNQHKVHFGSCLMLISKGLGDTIPIRYNCNKELVLVNINNIKL